MLYYSEKDKKFYKTEEELAEAEKAYDKAQEEIQQKAQEKKERAQKVEEAYKHAQEVRKAASEMIKTADEEYYALRNKFIEDYGSFHMSYSTKEKPDEALSVLSQALADWFWF